MRLLLQRVLEAGVRVAGADVARIGPGLLVLVGFGSHDGPSLPKTKNWSKMLKKVLELRIFPDAVGKLNRSVTEHGPNGGDVLLVSQFTLYADCRKGRRPSFHPAALPEVAAPLFQRFSRDLDALWPGRVQTGVFGEEMDVWLVNWGPVTIALEDESPNPGDSQRPARMP